MELYGLHHVTAVTAQVKRNLHFYTRILGLRLVKKTVNQDDVSAYHLFYADKLGTPGTDMTFFDWPMIGSNRPGTDSITRTMFRVNGRAALAHWSERFDAYEVRHHGIETIAGRDCIRFEDPEGQHLMLVDDRGAPVEGSPWDAEVPLMYALRGFYGVTLSVPRLSLLSPILSEVLGFEETGRYPNPENDQEEVVIFSLSEGGPGREVHVVEQPGQPQAQLGAGGVHHVAFRVRDDKEQREWRARIVQAGLSVSDIIDRFYFQSIYFRVSSGILFEIATDGPGFATDEEPDALGETLALPPFLEPYREQIEAGLRPIETVRF